MPSRLSNIISETNFVQIAGVLDHTDAETLVSHQVPFIGFPLKTDSHPEEISPENVRKIIRWLPVTVRSVLITYLKTAREINDLSEYLGTRLVQLHGNFPVTEIAGLRKNLILIKSIIIGRNRHSRIFSQLDEYSPFVDAFITDTFDSRTGASGATGKTHDWKISRKIVETSGKPVILAGGLNPSNIEKAIRTVRPSGVDSHTGVEDERGRKDPDKIHDFMKYARAGFRAMNSL